MKHKWERERLEHAKRLDAMIRKQEKPPKPEPRPVQLRFDERVVRRTRSFVVAPLPRLPHGFRVPRAYARKMAGNVQFVSRCELPWS